MTRHLASRTHTVQVNHLGFRPDDPMKRAVMPLGTRTTGWLGDFLFRVIRVSEFIQHPLNSPGARQAERWFPAIIEETALGRCAVCDLSDLTERGGYQVFSDTGASYPFLIYRDAWKRCFRLLLEWYRVASCAEAAAGYHERCHLDDCRLVSTGEHVDLVGGWHDAGDLRKWTSTMALISQRLAEFIEEHGDSLEALDVDEGFVWRQLERGASYLLKTVDPVSGLVWHDVASDSDNSCCVWTDNIPGTEDDRRVEPTCPADTAHHYVQAQCALARVLQARNPALAASALASAQGVWQRLGTARHENTMHRAASAMQLWQASGDTVARDIAWAMLRSLLDRQCTTARFGQDRIRGYLLDETGEIAFNEGFRQRGGRNLYVHMRIAELLARASLLWPEAPDASRWRDGLVTMLEGLAEPMLALSPYRAMPACLYQRGRGPENGRPLAGDLCFRYFGVEAEGNNFSLLETGAALALAARALGQPKWAAYGQKQLEWVLGFNPYETSMLTGLGYSQAAVFSFYVGQIPGGIINGVKGDEHDGPVLCLNREVEPMMMEYWSIHTAAMLRALALLENQPLS